MTSVRELYDGIASSAERAEEATRRVADGVEDLAKAARKVTAPASFAPPPFPFVPAQPSGGPVLDSAGRPTRRTSGGAGAAGGSGGGSKTLLLASDPLIRPFAGSGSIVMRRSDLEAEVALGNCQEVNLPSGGSYVWCPYGHYPGLGGGVLATTSGRSGGGGGRGSGRNAVAPDTTGNQDRSRTFSVADNSRGRGGVGASSTAESRAVIDELRGVRSDIQRLGRAIEGDGGAGLRFGGGL